MGSDCAVVIMSGGDAVSPFTTPDLACAVGLAAGNTATALRDRLLAEGHQVYTAPSMNARGEVQEPDPESFAPFGGMPVVLPAHLTVNSVGDIDAAGECLARFTGYLHDEYGVRDIDWIGHSNGGSYARAATRILQQTGSPMRVRSLTTLGTPWMGGVPPRFLVGEIDFDITGYEQFVEGLRAHVASHDLGLVAENTVRYMSGPGGWNLAQAGVLDAIPVLLVGGTYFESEGGDPTVWPFDGLVSRSSALAEGVPEVVLPQGRRLDFPVTHSIWVSDLAGLDWESGMTWNSDVLDALCEFLRDVGD